MDVEFILLRTSLKTTFVKELHFFKNINVARAYTGSSSRAGPRFHAAGDFALAAAVFFSLDYP